MHPPTLDEGGASPDRSHTRVGQILSQHWHHIASPATVAAIAPEGVDSRASESATSLIPPAAFVNPKLTNKIMRQLQDPTRDANVVDI